jgi:hypothetical protein
MCVPCMPRTIRRPLSGLLILILAVAGCSSSGGDSGTGRPQFSNAASKRFTPVKSPAPGPGKGRSGLLHGR